MVFYWSLSESKIPQVSGTLLNSLTGFHNVVVWMVSTRPLVSMFSGLCIHPLVIVPRAPITISIIVTFIFHSFFNYLAWSRYLSFFSLSFNFTQWSAGTAMSTMLKVLNTTEKTVRLIFLDSFCVVHISFVLRVKFQFLVYFPLDHLTHSAESSILPLLC